MATLSKEIQDTVIAKCQSQAAEITSSLSQALGQQFEASVDVEPQMLGELIANYPDPGLIVLSMVGSAGLVMAIPHREQVLPAWCAAPDKAGESRLATLGQELGMLLLPDDVIAEDSRQGWVPHIGQALQRGNCVDEAALLLQVKFDGDRVLQLIMAWPAQSPAAILSDPAPVAPKQPAPTKAATAQPVQPIPPVPQPAPRRRRPASMQDLPSYSRSLLKIKVPVIVTLASKRQPLGRIV